LAKGAYLIGLDIGSSSVKFVELRERKGRPIVYQLGVSPLAPETIVEGAIIDSYDLISTMKQLASAYHIRNRKVAISISGTPVIVKRLTLAYMTDQELAEAIDWEVERYLPFDLSEVNIDYHIIRSDEKRNQLEVLIAAVKKETIEEYLTVVNEAGFKLAVVDVDAFAVQNAYTEASEIGENETIILANLGASLMNLNIVSTDETMFTRDIALGGDSFTKEIQKQIGKTFEEAEQLKTNVKENNSQEIIVENVMNMAKSSLTNEILKSINFYNSTFEGKEVNKIVLSGGTALMDGLAEHIETSLNIPTSVMNPFNGIEINQKTVDVDLIESSAPVFAAAFGLALRRDKEGK